MEPYYKDENGILYCGDCLEIMPELNITVDAVITDPPYGTTKCKWDSVIPFDPMWECLLNVTKKNRAVVLFSGEPFGSLLRASQIRLYKYDWVWDKVKPNGHLVAKYRPMQRNENIIVFGEGKIKYNPQMTQREKNKTSKEYKRTEIMGGKNKQSKIKVLKQKYPQNIIVVSNASQKGKLHPTQKPVALIEYLIKTYTNENETVLDFTSGSGTTAIACMNTNRKYICIEKEEKYCKVAKNRIIQHKEQSSGE